MRKWQLVLVGLAVLAVAVPVAVIALGSDPAKAVVFTADQARAQVVQFVGQAEWTSDLKVTGPNDGAYLRYYDVVGKEVAASVNAHDGSVTTLFLPGNRGPSTGTTTTQDDAARSAGEFLTVHTIDVSGLDMTVSLESHGDTSDWAIRWQGHVGGVAVPRFIEVDVDYGSGRVFGYASVSHPYDTPGVPKVSQADAEEAARKVSNLPRVEHVNLQLAFADTGAQRLVYDIWLSGPQAGYPVDMMILHAEVQVDAMTGEAKVVAVG